MKVIAIKKLLRGPYNSDFVGIEIQVSKEEKVEGGFPPKIIFQLDKKTSLYNQIVEAGFDAYGEQKLFDMSRRNGWPYSAEIDPADCRKAGSSIIVSNITFKKRK